ncbi:thiamine-phosphate kinase [Thermoleophilia bacterium SCSIO 60948]|nr:thiamine-phosphate kinase [Thermoleophilia bacterium SCSIO 60948]
MQGGEFDLIRALRRRMAELGAPDGVDRLELASGDDAAVTRSLGEAATSVDLAIDGVHFDLAYTSPEQAGHKALAAALSDLAAMGAAPGEAYIGLGLPEGFGDDACLELATGIGRLAAECDVAVAGGDVARAMALTLAITVVGRAATSAGFIPRSGAVPGQAVVVTGELGAAAGGLALLRDPALADRLDPSLAEALVTVQRTPSPRFDAGAALAEAGATAMIDISDGLLADAGHIAESSGVAIEIDDAAVPIGLGLAELERAGGPEAFEAAIAGGEDYELLASVPDRAVAELEERAIARAVGVVVDGPPGEVRLASGRVPRRRGFDGLSRP